LFRFFHLGIAHKKCSIASNLNQVKT